MSTFHHKAKKSLGQHFLKSKSALSAIIDAGDIHADDVVLEIGPGKGVLTERLLALAGKVVAIEKDTELVAFLKGKFEKEIKEGKFELIEGDVLDLELGASGSQKSGGKNHSNPPISETLKPADPHGKGTSNFEGLSHSSLKSLKFLSLGYKLIANIPYNITGEIFRKFLESSAQPQQMVLLIQKEVADRIVARDKKESILSISVKAYGTPRNIMKVPARFFSPAPNVDSAIISIESIGKAQFHDVSEDKFFSVVKTGFAHKRKLLSGNLKNVFAKEAVENALKDLSPNTRAEDITTADWFTIAKAL